MKAQSLRGRRTFEMRASSCEEHIQRRVLPQPRRPYVLRRLGSAQKVYHRVRLGQPGGGGGGAAPVAAGARDAARLARAGGAAGRRRVGGDALLGVVARSADGRWLPGGGGAPAAGEADLACALQDGARGCPDCRTRSGSAGARPGDSRGRAAADDSGDRAVWGALAARRDRNDRPVWFESRAGGVCGAGAEHAELGREDRTWVGRPRGECVAQVAVRRSGADAEAAARPGAQPVRAVAAGQGEAEGDRGGGAQALLLRLLDDEGRAEL